jgi:DNA-binding NarL/FixJ family response regulator
MSNRIVILSDHSLLSDGVISQLKQNRSSFEFSIVDVLSENLIDRVIKEKPSILILDGSNPHITQSKLLLDLLMAFPSLQVINLNNQSPEVKVIRWGSKLVSGIDELISAIASGSSNPHENSPSMITTNSGNTK